MSTTLRKIQGRHPKYEEDAKDITLVAFFAGSSIGRAVQIYIKDKTHNNDSNDYASVILDEQGVKHLAHQLSAFISGNYQYLEAE